MMDKLLGRTAVNKTASRVIGKGINYTPDKKIQTVHSETPLPLIRPSRLEDDLTGIKFGRFTVMGKYKKGLWAVRCLCGRYSARRAKSIKNPNNNVDCCEECRQLDFLKRRERGRLNGTSVNQPPPKSPILS